MADAPVCHIIDPADVSQPIAPSLPNIPIATDMPSALAAINAMRQHLLRTSGQVKRNVPKPGKPGFKTKFEPNKGDKKQQGRWNEVSRSKEKVKIRNKDDPEQFVEVERINSLTMQDSMTGETWVWRR